MEPCGEHGRLRPPFLFARKCAVERSPLRLYGVFETEPAASYEGP